MSTKNQQIKLNLGCGFAHLDEYINVDIDKRTKPDIVHDLRKPFPGKLVKQGSVDEILLQDVLEHLTKEDAEVLLARCASLLRAGGRVRLRVPNPVAITNKFRYQPDLQMLYLYGDTSKNGEWGAHKYGYTPSIITAMAAPYLLHLTYQATEDTNYVFELQKLTPTGFAAVQPKTVTLAGFWALLTTPYYKLRGHQVIWCISQPLPIIPSKLLLRPLSRLVWRITAPTKSGNIFASTILKYSHLKTTS